VSSPATVPLPAELLPAESLGRVHFVGIGGAGLSAIARIMLARGITVSGSDAAGSPVLEQLRGQGATCFVGHAAEQLGAADTVVVSTAVRASNVEVVEARRRGLRLLPRSAALESVMQSRRVVAVAGTHGKTTTTALLTVMLMHCGADPSYCIGGDLALTGANAAEGSGDLFVVEADESDGAFLVYSPYAAIVTNVEADHLDSYGTETAYVAAFERFLDRIRPGGFVVCCADDPGAHRLAELARDRGVETITTGTAADADLVVSAPVFAGSSSRFSVSRDGSALGTVTLQIPGLHYVLDAACALAVGLRLGFAFADAAAGLAAFTGTRRRMERKGEADGVRVYDSYAHHPTEIGADLRAARALSGAGRLVVCFQPHMYSRTRVFAAAMGEALSLADHVVVMDVYGAREDPEPGVDGALVASYVGLDPACVEVRTGRDGVVEALVAAARPGDLVLTLGAGDVTLLGPLVLEAITARAAAEQVRGRQC
jgi:UDP-N-acetylmuramate--alanine ligase